MKPAKVFPALFGMIIFTLMITQCKNSCAQTCVPKDTIFHFEFGSANKSPDLKLSTLRKYSRSLGTCPDDGFYSFVPQTSSCFNNDWITLPEDHTPGDVEGNYMLVNASHQAADFFVVKLNGFKPATTYEFSTWLINVCRLNSGCPPLPPNILITLETSRGKKIAAFSTGQLTQLSNPHWKKYAGTFTTPDNNEPLLLTMKNTTNGGCGNDFAMDDIVLRECVIPEPIKEPIIEPNVSRPVITKKIPIPVVEEKKPTPVLQKEKINISVTDNIKRPTQTIKPSIKINEKKAVVAEPLRTRENSLVTVINTEVGEMNIELYDNGDIDGDTVSIYHNNELLIARAGLSAKPIQFSIQLSKDQPYHELIMVAENLGSIPPNTSVMVVTGNGKRQEVFISSSEKKNAKVVIKTND